MPSLKKQKQNLNSKVIFTYEPESLFITGAL